jgi:hypothetical protein
MTVTTQASKIIYQGNGATTAFSFTFEIPEASDAFVYFTAVDGTQTLVNSATYSISGLGNSAGGTLTYPLVGSAIAVGTKLTIQRVMPLTQEVDLVNQDGFYPEVVESGLDTLEFQIQQLQEQYSRAIIFPVSDNNFNNALPTQAQRAGFVLGFDSQGNPTAVSTLPTNIVSAAMVPIVEAATVADALALLGITGDLTLNSLVFTGSGPTQTVAPTGNGLTTLAELSIQGTTQSSTTREFLVNIGLTSNLGASHSGIDNDGDKVALYSGLVANPGSGDVWAFNTVTTLESGSVSNMAAFGYELDFNNNSGTNCGDGDGGAGFSRPTAVGLGITGNSGYRCTTAIEIGGSAAMWNRGISIVLDSVKQASFQDLGNAAVSIDIRNVHNYGIDMATASFADSAIRCPNNSTVSWRNAAGSADIAVITVDGANNEFFGGTHHDRRGHRHINGNY